jgi:uncharacterized protein YifN (PemK superfamily)
MMAIKEHPPIGTVLICDFQTDFRLPEMVKVRPVSFLLQDLLQLREKALMH